jgi:exonuclease SbcD
MKIAVTADVHLGIKDEHSERYTALENILEQTEAEEVENLIVAGDLFDSGFSNYSEFETLCRRHLGVQLHIIPGNHDPSINEKSIVGDNIQIYSEPTMVEFDSTTFLFVPYRQKTNVGDRIAEIEQNIDGKQWILIAHGDYYGGVKELNPLEPGTYMPLSKKTIERFGPSVVLLGHIHKPINWGNVYYAGSPCGLDISETGKRRFLVYDTSTGSVVSMSVATDVLYFDESFAIVPSDAEASLLRQEIEKRIKSWSIASSDYSKVCVRVEALGYAADRSAILSVLREGFDRFRYYRDKGPCINELSVSSDRQLNTISERTIRIIHELDWNFGGDEPTREQVTNMALNVIYGDSGK